MFFVAARRLGHTAACADLTVSPMLVGTMAGRVMGTQAGHLLRCCVVAPVIGSYRSWVGAPPCFIILGRKGGAGPAMLPWESCNAGENAVAKLAPAAGAAEAN